MKFDFCIGNPPYQGDNHMQLYPDFYLESQKIAGFIDMIFPTGWQAPKNALNLKKMNTKDVKEDRQIVLIDNIHNAFANVVGAFETNIILWKKDYDNGNDGKQLIYTDDKNPEYKRLICNKSDVLSTMPDILHRILSHFTKDIDKNLSSIIYSGRSVLKFNNTFLSDYPDSVMMRLKSIQRKQPNTMALSQNEEYELKTSSFEVLEPFFAKSISGDESLYYKIYGSYKNKRTIRYIAKKYMEPRYKDSNNLSHYKVLLAEAASAGNFGATLSDTIIAGPDTSCTPTFIGIGTFQTESEAENCAKYIKTKLFRTLLGALKTTRHNPGSVFAYIPIQDFTSSSDIDWSQSISDIDRQLYRKYNLSPEEIDFIETHVKEMQ